MCLTIAGSDCSAGAGIQADLKTFQALGAHGTSVITSVIAENDKKVYATHSIPARHVREQLHAIEEAFKISSIKIGLVTSASVAKEIALYLKEKPKTKVVTDPVISSSSGKTFLTKETVETLVKKIFPKSTLVTPNIPEVEILAQKSVSNIDEAIESGIRLGRQWGTSLLIKGGHLKSKHATDIYISKKGEVTMCRQKRATPIDIHGTGCTLSAAICKHLGDGLKLKKSILEGKKYISSCINSHYKINQSAILNW